MGHRDASGWHVDQQAPFQGGVKADKNYELLLALNGTVATLVVDNKNVFTHVYAPRVDQDGFTYGLNAGMVGLGANNAIARLDNVAVQVLPPEWTLELDEGFGDEPGWLAPIAGDWDQANAGGGRFIGTAIGDPALSTFELGSGADSYVELSAKLKTGEIGGLVFDVYGTKDFKFVALSAATDQVLIGHVKGGSWKVDAAVSKTINDNTDYTLGLQLKGTTVSVTLNGQAITGYAFNGLVVDGDVGILAENGSASFDSFGVKSNDADLVELAESISAAAAAGDMQGSTLTQDALDAIAEVAIADWMDALGDDPRLAGLSGLRFAVADLPDLALGTEEGGTITLDADAAGHGWFIDTTPWDSSEFALRSDDDVLSAQAGSDAFGAMDLLTVVRHEIGHALGFGHDDDLAVMRDDLDAGVRYALDANAGPAPSTPSTSGTGGAVDLGAPIDWTADSGSLWSDTPTVTSNGKSAKNGSTSIAEFKVQVPPKSEGYDSLGKALLGK
jgi:hypothetical protein